MKCQPVVAGNFVGNSSYTVPFYAILTYCAHALHKVFPFVANTHTETSTTGATMSLAFEEAFNIIKSHVGANDNDILISAGAGMTMLVNKFQRILGLKIHEKYVDKIKIENSPIVFVSHMEHHSNQTSWLETIAEVKFIPHSEDGSIDLINFLVNWHF